MSVEAVRKVTIIVDVKPGEIVKPDLSWISAMSDGMKELVTEQNSLTEIVKKTHEESESLVKTQTEAIKVENELREQKTAASKEAQSQAKDEADLHKKTIDGKRREQETYSEWLSRTQAQHAENQRKLDEQAASRRSEGLRQQKQQQEEAAKQGEIPVQNQKLPLLDESDTASSSRLDTQRQQAKDEADLHKSVLEEKKREQETYDEWFARTQAEYAENQRKLDEQAANRRAEALNQQKQQQQQQQEPTQPFEIPAPNPRMPLRDPDAVARVDIKPGEVIKPDLKDLVNDQNALTEIVKKTQQESESLVKTQTEAIKVENELREQKTAAAIEAQGLAKNEADQHKKAIEEKKQEQETYDEWFARTQAEYAENQRKLDEQAANRRAEALNKQQQQQQQPGESQKPFEIPEPNPRLPLREPGEPSASRVEMRDQQLQQQRERQQRADDAERQRRIQEHQKELAEIDRMNAQEKAKQEQDERKLQEQKFEEAQRTFQKIKVAELANVRDRRAQEQAEQEKKVEDASRLFEKIRKAEKANIRERLQQEQEEEEKKVEAANRMFEKIRKAEKTAVRERLQQEQEDEEKKVEAASRMFEKIRKAEKTAVRERIQEEQEEEEKKIEAANRIFEKIRKAEKAAVRERIEEAEDTFKKIKEAESKHATDRREGAEKAEDDMPKHWRNVGLNAGQAVASVARYIGHMRLLKNVGGDALEKVAKEFMTIQSRVETISASTSAFTNFGTMIDGLEKAGKATEDIVVMQGILGKETSATQNLTMGLGKAAQAVMPMIAPMQLTFTAITAAIVAADIAMDFFVESETEAAEKAAKLIQTYDEGLDRVIKKLQIEADLLHSQNGLIETQWEIKKLMAGDAGLSAEDNQRMMDEKRKQADAQTQQSLRDSVVTTIQAGVPEEVKKAQEENKQEAERIAKEQSGTRALIADLDRRIDEGQRGAIFGERDRAEEKMAKLNKEAQDNFERKGIIDIATDADLQEKLKKVKVTDGAIENFDDILNDFKWSDNPTAKKSMTELSKQMSEAASLVAGQQSSAYQASEEAKMQKKAKEQETVDLSDRLADEEAVAERFKLTDSKFATDQVDMYLKEMEKPTATLDEKKMSVDNIRDALSRADLVTQDVAKVLDRGASAKPEEIRSALTDASEFTSAERKEFEDLIEKADKAIQKAESDAEEMAVVAEKLTRMLEVNSKQLNDLQRAIESRDGF